MRINEIFYSLQGEGAHTGMPAIFVRLSGCNLKCPFCDTDHEPFTEMTNEQILSKTEQYPAKTIIFTGGEPALQLTPDDLADFKTRGYTIHIETNGTRNLPHTHVDWITVSPKPDYCSNADVRQEQIDEVKVVFDGKINVAKYLDIPAKRHSLQPCDVGNDERNKEITRQCIAYILAHPEWQLSVQVHKVLDIA